MIHDFYIGIHYHLEYDHPIEIEKGGIFDKQDPSGKEGLTVSGFGLSFTWDTRDNLFYTRRGTYIETSVTNFNHTIQSTHDFTRYIIDFRIFLPLFTSHILGFQCYMSAISGDPPFQMLSMLGGPELMRGFYKGRYRDKNMILFQTEYKFPLFWRFNLAVFAGMGQVSDRLENFKTKEIKFALGGGIRFRLKKDKDIHFRLDIGYGFGEEKLRVYFKILEAF